MEGTGGKRNNSCLNISDLPDNVIECILECLPIQDAVKTSALARSWRYKWTTISVLTFGYYFARYLQDKSLSESDFTSIITNILLVHCGSTIHTFALAIPDNYVGVGSRNIHNWMLSLSRKGVKEFFLTYRECSPNEFYKLPSHLFTYLNLTDIYLSYCIFNPPSRFRGFPKLANLRLSKVTLEKGSFGCLISNCPLLETLSIHTCFGSGHLNICSPSLRGLYVGGGLRSELESIYIGAENVKTLWLNGRFRTHLAVKDSSNKVNNMIEELDRLPKIKELCIGWGTRTFEYITAAGAPRMLPTPLIHLKKVIIYLVDFATCAQGNSAVCLIRSAPNLQDLDISADSGSRIDGEHFSSFPREDWALNCLQTVELSLVRGSRPDLEFIKSVLASSPSLNLMNIHLHSSVDAKVKSWISEELLKAYRASPKTEVLCMQNGWKICL